MTNILMFISLILLTTVIFILLLLFKKFSRVDTSVLISRFDAIEKSQERFEVVLREEMAHGRDELNKMSREQRQELAEAFKTLGDSVVKQMMDIANMQKAQFDTFSVQLASFAKASGERLDSVRMESSAGAKQLREEVVITLNGISETITKTMGGLASIQKAQLEAFATQLASFAQASGEKLDGVRVESTFTAKQLREEIATTLKVNFETMINYEKSQLEVMSTKIEKLVDTNEKKLESVRVTVEGKLQSMQLDNAKQLEQMRQTVDEKLQGTLEKRLGESFKQVSERLELVHKGLGEMQTLATGVGDLKKVLTNVKTRGTWGEVQLGTLLEQVLNPDQFGSNVATKDGGERVEFAIKLPGQGIDKNEHIWLPIDAKFPIEDYQRLIEAQEKGDMEGVEAASKQLDNSVKLCSKDICGKYLNPPKTTDFGILFLPIEGLFAEVIRRTGLTEAIQRENRVIIAGPTTL
jgi:DNA recombination protein RmuC